jgi:hypothetical protein
MNETACRSWATTADAARGTARTAARAARITDLTDGSSSIVACWLASIRARSSGRRSGDEGTSIEVESRTTVNGPSPLERLERELSGLPLLSSAGAVYLFMGLGFGAAWLLGGVDSSLFPTGWLFPAVLLSTGLLMTFRRRADVVLVVWFAFALAVYLLDMTIVTAVLERGLSDTGGFDSTIIVFLFALVPLLLKPQFRS